MRALEEELVRTKVAYNTTLQEKNVIADENKELKEILSSYGIAYSPGNRSNFVPGRSTSTLTTVKNYARSVGQKSNHSSDHVNGHAQANPPHINGQAQANPPHINGQAQANPSSREQPLAQANSTYSASLPCVSGTHANSISPAPTLGSNTSLPLAPDRKRSGSELSRSPHTVHHQNGMDHDQLGIDFVLA